jgi:hypothetical protein
MVSTLDATPSAETYSYAPITLPSSAPTSVTIQTWFNGLTSKMVGALGSFEFEADGIGLPRWTFNFKGRIPGTSPNMVDAAAPTSPAFAVNTAIPLTTASIVNIGIYTAPKVRSFKFIQNHELETRWAQTVVANPGENVRGFSTNSMRGEIEVVLEASALAETDGVGTAVAGLDPQKLLRASGTIDFKYKVYTGGSYAPYRFEVPKMQVTEFDYDEAGAVVLWRIKGMCGAPVDPAGGSPAFPWRVFFPTS